MSPSRLMISFAYCTRKHFRVRIARTQSFHTFFFASHLWFTKICTKKILSTNRSFVFHSMWGNWVPSFGSFREATFFHGPSQWEFLVSFMLFHLPSKFKFKPISFISLNISLWNNAKCENCELDFERSRLMKRAMAND